MKILMYVFFCVGSFLTVGAAGASDNGGDLWETTAIAIVGLVLAGIAVLIGRRIKDHEDQ